MPYLGAVKPTETTSSVLRSTYTGDGSTTTFNLPGPVANETSIIATINGVTQQDAAYTTNGSQIIFSGAPALGDSIELRTISGVGLSYAPSAGSVTTGILADGAVTSGKINDASVTGAKLGTGAAVANIGARAITAAQVPAGSVIQVVSTQSTTAVSVTTTTATSIGLSAAITVSANSKVLVLTVVPWFESGSGTWSNAGTSNIFQNGTQVCYSEHTGTTNAVAAAWTNPLNYITGALSAGTYTFEVKHSVTIGGTHVCMRDNRIGTIMLLEIAS